jgi:pimeloyl-ACP methyl ester carboxylesterase
LANIVLIHGAFHGGWCWRDSVDLLRARGHRVLAPSLTGLAERSHLLSPAVDLETHIQDIVNEIEWAEMDDVVLVAHSYGGMPVTGAADRIAERLAALVFLDAFTPDDGDSAISVRSAVPGFIPLSEPDARGGIACPPARIFGLEGELAAWADRRLTPHPYETMNQPVHLTGAWRNVGTKVFIRCQPYPAPYFDRYYDAAAAAPDWTALAGEWTHNRFMTHPDWFVGLLETHALG